MRYLSHVDEYLTLKYKYMCKYSGHKYKYKYKYQVLHLCYRLVSASRGKNVTYLTVLTPVLEYTNLLIYYWVTEMLS